MYNVLYNINAKTIKGIAELPNITNRDEKEFCGNNKHL